MGIPHTGWPVAADDGEPSGRAGSTAAGGPASGGISTTYPDRAGVRLAVAARQPTGRCRSQDLRRACWPIGSRLRSYTMSLAGGCRGTPRSPGATTSAPQRSTPRSRNCPAGTWSGAWPMARCYRASPAEYVIGLEGVPGLVSYVDAMGGEFSCRSRQVTWRLPPEDISWALRLPADQQVSVVRYLWAAGRRARRAVHHVRPGRLRHAGRTLARRAGLPKILNLLQLTGVADAPAAAAGRCTPRHRRGCSPAARRRQRRCTSSCRRRRRRSRAASGSRRASPP